MQKTILKDIKGMQSAETIVKLKRLDSREVVMREMDDIEAKIKKVKSLAEENTRTIASLREKLEAEQARIQELLNQLK